uniref:Uncharacterized protein n=1 Tax=Oryza nivara TaxID=4536 RepID=A0A0E0HQN6_ORYNI
MRCSLKPPVTYGASSRPHRIAHPHRLLVLIVNRGNLIQVVARRGPSSTSSNKPASFRRWSLSAAVAAGCTTVAALGRVLLGRRRLEGGGVEVLESANTRVPVLTAAPRWIGPARDELRRPKSRPETIPREALVVEFGGAFNGEVERRHGVRKLTGEGRKMQRAGMDPICRNSSGIWPISRTAVVFF